MFFSSVYIVCGMGCVEVVWCDVYGIILCIFLRRTYFFDAACVVFWYFFLLC